jgi:hypothetical protein
MRMGFEAVDSRPLANSHRQTIRGEPIMYGVIGQINKPINKRTIPCLWRNLNIYWVRYQTLDIYLVRLSQRAYLLSELYFPHKITVQTN